VPMDRDQLREMEKGYRKALELQNSLPGGSN
jgi:hypothetical protein